MPSRRKISETKLVRYTDARENSRERKAADSNGGMLHSQVLEKISKKSAVLDRETHMKMMLTPPKQESGVHHMGSSHRSKEGKADQNILQIDSSKKEGEENKFKKDETRALLEKYLEYMVQHSQANISDQDNEAIMKSVKRLDLQTQLEDYLSEFFICYNLCYKLALQHSLSGDVVVPLAGRERRRLILRQEVKKEEVSPRKKKFQIEVVRAENEALRGELFRLREKNAAYQKKILGLVEQFRQRKQTYLDQIKRLTTIIRTTVQQLPALLLDQSLQMGEKSGRQKSQHDLSSEFNNTITSYFNNMSQAAESKAPPRPSSIKKVSSLHWVPLNSNPQIIDKLT